MKYHNFMLQENGDGGRQGVAPLEGVTVGGSEDSTAIVHVNGVQPDSDFRGMFPSTKTEQAR